ncbi:MAG: TIGR01212 family radical SAM protein, partial [Oscillospiraceae bacterium]
MSDFKYSDTNKHYHTQSYYLKKRFGRKTVKVSLNGNFTCPNRDGTKGFGGCKFCSDSGSGDFGGDPNVPIEEQFTEVRKKLINKWGEPLYIPYFQANTNTYGSIEKIKTLFESALTLPNVVGLAVSTRPDCLSDVVADYLEELSKRTYLVVELGLQTIHDKTAEALNRCHSYTDFLHGYEKLNRRSINVCVHIINSLPGETREMMLETARAAAALRPHAVKIHMLHIIRGTALAEEYEKEPFPLLSPEEYADLVCDQIELMPPETIIERITGDGAKADLIAPRWTLDKKRVMNSIDLEFA